LPPTECNNGNFTSVQIAELARQVVPIMQPRAKPNGAGPVIGILRCVACGKTIDVRDSDGLRYVESNAWPECCGEIMLFVLTEQPTATGAASDNGNG
jgi:hypothetical protein